MMGELVKYSQWKTIDVASTQELPPGSVVEVHVSAWGFGWISCLLSGDIASRVEQLLKRVMSIAADRAIGMDFVGAEYRKDSDLIVMQFRSRGVAVSLIVGAVVAALTALGISWAIVKEFRLIVVAAPVAAERVSTGIIIGVIVAGILGYTAVKGR